MTSLGLPPLQSAQRQTDTYHHHGVFSPESRIYAFPTHTRTQHVAMNRIYEDVSQVLKGGADQDENFKMKSVELVIRRDPDQTSIAEIEIPTTPSQKNNDRTILNFAELNSSLNENVERKKSVRKSRGRMSRMCLDVLASETWKRRARERIAN